ncbi:hypothetical protein BJX61DRAFT_539578 [Aspergillus egyptiacus]|nr:hypothetical protein BJX61DRAFT_539578 [Aspergillus egyptiacus]
MCALKLVSALAIFAATSRATIINRPAIKDATIFRSTISCPECPQDDCYKCTYGFEDTLRVNTGGLAWIRSIVGFQFPEDVDPSAITECTVQFPAFKKLPPTGFDMTVVPAAWSDWDEETVNGDNAPASTDSVMVMSVPALTNPPLLDVTNACQMADDDGQFSIYLGVEYGSYEIWSKDSGSPAILHITYDD